MKKIISLLCSILVAVFCLLPLQATAQNYLGYCGWFKDKDGNIVDVYETKYFTYWLVVHTPEGDKWVYYTPYGGNPDPNDPNNGKGIATPDIEEILKHARGADEQVLPEEIVFWLDSILGRELTEHGFGPESFWNPWDGTASTPGRDSGNPGDDDGTGGYIDIEKLKQEGGIAQQMPGGSSEEGPFGGYNGANSIKDWINSQGGSNNSDTNANDDKSPSTPNMDDGSVKGPPEIVDPAPFLGRR